MISKRLIIDTVFILVGIALIAVNNIFISDVFPIVVPILNVIGALIIIIPPFIFLYSRYKTNKEIEEQFMVFISDITEAIDSGMTLPLAIKHVSKKSYGAFTPYVKELAAKVDWGIPFDLSLIHI